MNIKNIVSAVEVPPFFFRLTVTAILLALFALPYDEAHARHTDACMRLSDASPPSPRAECLARRPPGAPAGPCTRLTNASPPSPRAECLARLSPLPPLRISSARFRHDGGTTIMTRMNNGVLLVRGTNVAAPGVIARRDGDAYTMGPYADPTCVPPGCAALRIDTKDETGPQTFRLLAPDGHQVVQGTFTIVPHPAPVSGGNTRPPVSGRSGPGSGGGNPCFVVDGRPTGCPNNTTFDPATCSCR